MAHLDVAGLEYGLPDGRLLFRDVSFRVADGARVALVGANGSGKSTILRMVTDEVAAHAGAISRSGRVGYMRQFIGDASAPTTVRQLLLGAAPEPVRRAAEVVSTEEARMHAVGDEQSQLRYANALVAYTDVGGYDMEHVWELCTQQAFGLSYDECALRPITTFSGGEQKRLVLEALLRGPFDVLLLDEPDNFLDVPGKRWLEDSLISSGKTSLFVSHDRELLARVATRIVTIEGRSAWTHPASFATYAEGRAARLDRLDGEHKRWDDEHARLKQLVLTLRQQAAISPDMASRYRAMQTRLAKFEESERPAERPRDQKILMKIPGGRTAVRAVRMDDLELQDLTYPFSMEIFYGDRVAVIGANGTGKSHLLRLLAGFDVAHEGRFSLGSRVVAGWFSQLHDDPVLRGKTLIEALWADGRERGRAMSLLSRYELNEQGDQLFDTLSGGQQARFQVARLEASGATLLLLDEPTDNLDLASAEALEAALAGFDGTVIAVTHDRWFARGFSRFLAFGRDGEVTEADVPDWGIDER
ncbi:MAG: hypothetical protein QOG52_2731 [Frankiaceae bacterium]|nr:hypothetical protein [Frankiaceae bacterium]